MLVFNSFAQKLRIGKVRNSTAFMMGGALGLAVLASLAAARTEHLAAARHGTLPSLTLATTWRS